MRPTQMNDKLNTARWSTTIPVDILTGTNAKEHCSAQPGYVLH